MPDTSCFYVYVYVYFVYNLGMGFTDVLCADDSFFFFFFLHRCRCEETTDEAEEQGDIFRYRNDFVSPA